MSVQYPYLKLCGSVEEEDEVLPCLTLQDLRPCTAFAELRGLDVQFNGPASLTDADLLELVSPRMEYFLVNYGRAWQIDSGGITLSGLVQLLRQCPLLDRVSLVIDIQTFTKIPEGLDVSFPPRTRLKIYLLDSDILPGFGVSVYSARTGYGLGA